MNNCNQHTKVQLYLQSSSLHKKYTLTNYVANYVRKIFKMLIYFDCLLILCWFKYVCSVHLLRPIRLLCSAHRLIRSTRFYLASCRLSALTSSNIRSLDSAGITEWCWLGLAWLWIIMSLAWQVCTHTHRYIYTYICTCICVYIYVHTHIHNINIYIYMYLSVCVCVYIYI